ncbi:hypothetical protein Tco_1321746 [Tanacetum coccineum]
MAFLDLEKTYDSVPWELIWKTLVDKGTSRRYIKAISADDIVLDLRIMRKVLNMRLEAGKGKAIEEQRPKGTENLFKWMCVLGTRFYNLRSLFGILDRYCTNPGGLTKTYPTELKMKWRAATGVICDRNVPLKLKGKFYRVAVRPAMLYGLECWPITKALANRVEVAELRMLRWTCGKTLLDMIPNGVYRAQLEVETIINKMREGRLRWFGHVRRRPQSAPSRRLEEKG